MNVEVVLGILCVLVLAALAFVLFKLRKVSRALAVIDARAEKARAAAHDLRSPLTALKFLASADGISEEQRQLARRAVERIEEIAGGLSRPD